MTKGFFIEIPGAEKADKLASRFRGVFEGVDVRVSRSIRQAELRVSNMNDLIPATEVAARIAEIGSVGVKEVRTNPLQMLRNGLLST